MARVGPTGMKSLLQSINKVSPGLVKSYLCIVSFILQALTNHLSCTEIERTLTFEDGRVHLSGE